MWDQPDAAIETLEGAAAIRRFVEDWQGTSYGDVDEARAAAESLARERG